MAERWTPSEGETVHVVDRDSNDFGKTGTIAHIRTVATDLPYGVRLEGNTSLRFFSRDGLTWVSSPTAQPAPVPEPQAWKVGDVPRYVLHIDPIETGDVNGTLTVRGNPSDLLSLAAELVKRG